MAVYLNSGMVLLNSGMVATDAGCCCGGCSVCCFTDFGAIRAGDFCDNGDGTACTSYNCDGTTSGSVDPDSLWRTQNFTCCPGVPDGCHCDACTDCFQTFDPDTCVYNDECATSPADCGTCTVVSSITDQCFPCFDCCIDGVCSTRSVPDCIAAGGTPFPTHGCSVPCL